MVETNVAPPPKALVNLATKFDQADKEVERLEQAVKDAKKVRDAAEKKFVDEMTTQSVESFRTPGMGGFRTQACVYPNVKDREVLGAWIKKRKLKWLYTISVNGQKTQGIR